MKSKVIPILLILSVLAFILIYFTYEKKSTNSTLIVYGNVDVRQVSMGFRVAGRVDQIYFEEGDFVEKGKLLGKLDQQPYLDLVKEAKANVDSIKSSLNNAALLLNRRKDLIEDGGVSQEDLENATSNKTILESNLASAEASLAVATTNLSFTEVYAPTNAIILSRIREPGTVVNVGDPIYSLSVISPVWIRAYIAEPSLGVVTPGMEAEVYTDTIGGKIYKGRVGFISPVAEFTPKTVETTQLRSDLVYRLRIYIDEPDQGLRQGMPVTVKFLIKDHKLQNDNFQDRK